MKPDSVIAVGGSVGALECLQTIVADLPVDIPAAILVILHIPPHLPSNLSHVLSQRGGLPAVEATDGTELEESMIYVAPPDRHLVIAKNRIRLTREARENRSRPAIDPLFRSAARWYGERVIAVLLSGMLDDGVAGLQAVKRRGGSVVVLSPEDTRFSQMPCNAI